jgi:hypothetical protein
MGGTRDLLLKQRLLAAEAASSSHIGLNLEAQQQRDRVLLGCC